MDTDALIGKVIKRSQVIEDLLRKHYPAAKGRGLFAAIKSLADTLPVILTRAIRVVATVRNDAAHPNESKPVRVPPDFDRLCAEIESLIPYFARQPQAKPAPPPKVSKPAAPKPRTTAAILKPQNKGAPPKPT